jgi:glycosyltransferase involved in cell wall biosynthesis
MTLSQPSTTEARKPLVTVILSTYNWSEVLPYSIQSVLNQTFVDFELLVIGDGCTDNSAEVVQNFLDPRVRWINLPKNTGSQSGPNNEGLRQAKGSLIAYLGHDDLWSIDHLDNLTSFCSNREQIFATAAIIWLDDVCNIRFISALNELIAAPENANNWHTPSAIIHSRSLLDKVGFWREYSPTQNFHPDNEFFSRLDKIQPKKMIGSVSVAKVPAAWRKNIYQTRDVAPQKSVFEQLIKHPYILRDTAIAFYSKHLNTIEGQLFHHKNYEEYRHFKGLP